MTVWKYLLFFNVDKNYDLRYGDTILDIFISRKNADFLIFYVGNWGPSVATEKGKTINDISSSYNFV